MYFAGWQERLDQPEDVQGDLKMEAHYANLNRQISLLAEGMAENRSEHKSFQRRLEVLEENSRRQNDILVTLQRQADAIEAMNEKIDMLAGGVNQLAGRVSQMEREPAQNWKKIGFEIIKYIVLAAMGAAAGFLMK